MGNMFQMADTCTPQGWEICFRRDLNDWEVDRVAKQLLNVSISCALPQPLMQSSGSITMTEELL